MWINSVKFTEYVYIVLDEKGRRCNRGRNNGIYLREADANKFRKGVSGVGAKVAKYKLVRIDDE